MITVFIGTYNRLETLDRTVASYEKFETPHELVIVDNGTTNPLCLRLLKTLERDDRVADVFHLPACVSMEEATDNFNVCLRDYVEGGCGGEWFAISEADVCFDGTDPGALDAYLRVAKELGRPAGPHLYVGPGIPEGYPLRSRVLACESRLLYRDDMRWLDGIPYSDWQTDTTFHLFPRTRFFHRLHMNPVRVGPPYDAMHLDWHLDVARPTVENGIYIPDRRPMGSWGKSWIREFWAAFQRSPEEAFAFLQGEPVDRTDLCNNSFMRSWCYQYGHGCEPDRELAEEWLHQAIPHPHPDYWSHRDDWMRMIFDNDFSALGWDT